MTAQSSAVVHAHLLSSRADWSPYSKGVVITRYTFKADRYLKGNLGSTFEIVEPGGSMPTMTTSVPGAPTYQAGEEVVLFVWTVPGTSVHRTLGFDQGAFRVKRTSGAMTVNHSQPLTGGGQFVESDDFKAGVRSAGTSHNFDEFMSQVGGAVRRVAAQRNGVKQ